MKQSKLPSIVQCSRPLQFRMGKDSRGNWVVQDDQGVCGGLFVDRKHALRFAMLENGSRPQAVVMVPGIFELDIGRGATSTTPMCRASERSPDRRNWSAFSHRYKVADGAKNPCRRIFSSSDAVQSVACLPLLSR